MLRQLQAWPVPGQLMVAVQAGVEGWAPHLLVLWAQLLLQEVELRVHLAAADTLDALMHHSTSGQLDRPVHMLGDPHLGQRRGRPEAVLVGVQDVLLVAAGNTARSTVGIVGLGLRIQLEVECHMLTCMHGMLALVPVDPAQHLHTVHSVQWQDL